MGFQGMKRLNRIQSIVFDAAYNTNENLLISAPTGAGKTNIATLTILREIKQNIEEGVIKKDKFKVGYLLPLTLLAEYFGRFYFRQKKCPKITPSEIFNPLKYLQHSKYLLIRFKVLNKQLHLLYII